MTLKQVLSKDLSLLTLITFQWTNTFSKRIREALQQSQAYLGPCQTSIMDLFDRTKRSFIDVSQGPKQNSDRRLLYYSSVSSFNFSLN